MNSSQVLTLVTVFAIAFAAFNLIITLDKVGKLTGYAAAESGTANLTILSDINLNFTLNMINWSSGNVLSPNTWAYLNSEGVMTNNQSFSNVTNGLRLESLSSTDIAVNLSSTLSAFNFLDGGQARVPASSFQWKMSNFEPTSCEGTLFPSSYQEVSTSPTTICTDFNFEPTTDVLEIDLAVNISWLAPSGIKGAVITATGYCGGVGTCGQ